VSCRPASIRQQCRIMEAVTWVRTCVQVRFVPTLVADLDRVFAS
jgi:hypothetical protein